MKGVVADASPLIILARSELLGVLRHVAGPVFAPTTVFRECVAEGERPGALAIKRGHEDKLLEVVDAPEGDGALNGLGAGEAAALALALARNCPLLIDDRLGRMAAKQRGLSVVGSAGVLIAAKRAGLVTAIAPILGAWADWGYFLAPDLKAEVLKLAGEVSLTPPGP